MCVVVQVPLWKLVSFAEEFADKYAKHTTSKSYQRAIMEIIQVHFLDAIFYCS